MSAEIVEFPGVTQGEVDPDKVLQGPLGQLKDVVVVGTTTDGTFWIGSSSGDYPEIVWLLQQALFETMLEAREE